jgi:hypothetical protein
MKVPASFGGRRRELIDNTNAKMNSVKAEVFISSLPGEALLAVRSQPRRTMQCILRPPGVLVVAGHHTIARCANHALVGLRHAYPSPSSYGDNNLKLSRLR